MPETIITKRCSSCKQFKPISKFYKRTGYKYNHRSVCIICWSKYTKKYKQTEKGKIACRKGNLRYKKTEKGKITEKRYRQNEKGKAARKRYRLRHSEQRRAGSAIHIIVRNGKLPRPDTLKCSYCPTQAKEYHHPDYSKPLYVLPVCIKCHKKIPKN